MHHKSNDQSLCVCLILGDVLGKLFRHFGAFGGWDAGLRHNGIKCWATAGMKVVHNQLVVDADQCGDFGAARLIGGILYTGTDRVKRQQKWVWHMAGLVRAPDGDHGEQDNKTFHDIRMSAGASIGKSTSFP